jgi:hypothetical protein
MLAWPVLLAVALTAFNDHVLKDLHPGFVTGKISDFAGLFFFPFLLTSVSGHLRWLSAAALGTAAAFILVKVTGLVFGPWAIEADPTDLAALVSPAAAVFYGRWRWPCAAR